MKHLSRSNYIKIQYERDRIESQGGTTIDTLESRLTEALDALEEELNALKHYINHKKETI
tara:strand:+ start:601 stop:780 length:180 start_codon:yes stop_codon:yes gene_type:complete